MEEQVIVIKIRTGDPLLVPKRILIADSLKFRHLIDELKFEEIEIEDFSPEAVNLFLTLLERRQLCEIEDGMFRELHKLSVVFEVKWLKESSRDWLKGKMNSATDVGDKRYIFDETWYIFDKWGERCMVDGLVSVLAIKDNSTFISEYVLGVENQLETGQIDLLLKLGGSNTDLFLQIMLQILGRHNELSEIVKWFLQKMNLALCCEQNEKLYLEVFDVISNLPGISTDDLRFSHQLVNSTVRLVSSRREKRRTTRSTTLLYDAIELVELLTSSKTLNDITKAVAEDQATSMFDVVDLLFYVYSMNAPNREEEQIFLTTLTNICRHKKLQKVSNQYLDINIIAFNYSNLEQSHQLINLLKEIKNNDKMSTYHENVIIKCGKLITITEDSERGRKDVCTYQHAGAETCTESGLCGPILRKKTITETEDSECGRKDVYTFQHPGAETCTESDSECGFIIRKSKQHGDWRATLSTNSEDYTNTGVHLHDIISTHVMSQYGVLSGKSPDGTKVTVASRWSWMKTWFPHITGWGGHQCSVRIAYNVTDYLVATPE